jgi:ABC-type antimicrobial peptide transport system permease subunit
VPLAQSPTWGPAVTIAIRTRGAPGAFIPAVTRALAGVNPGISISFTSLDAQVLNSLARPRLLATLSTFFGGLALLLAVIGLYGAIAYGVARRRTEIGVRIALGATRRGVIGMVIGEAGVVVLLGVLAGGALAVSAGRVLAAFLYGVAPNDAATLGIAAASLALVALLAGAIPAWRAGTVDPMEALRRE